MPFTVKADESEPNPIPHLLHFFWSGGPIPERELRNLWSFVLNTDPAWKIIVWTDQARHIRTPLISHEPRLNPDAIDIREYWPALEEATVAMKRCLESSDAEKTSFSAAYRYRRNAIRDIKQIIYRLSVGLIHPSAVKDLFVNLALYLHGGYYFDLDSFAHTTIQAIDAPHGYLVLNDCRGLSAMASVAGHPFWLESLLNLEAALREISGTDFKPNFFSLSPLKDRNRLKRNADTFSTTGSINRTAHDSRIVKRQRTQEFVGHPNFDEAFKEAASFKYTYKGITRCRLEMGVTLVDQFDPNSWRWQGQNPKHAFDDLNLISPEPIKRIRY